MGKKIKCQYCTLKNKIIFQNQSHSDETLWWHKLEWALSYLIFIFHHNSLLCGVPLQPKSKYFSTTEVPFLHNEQKSRKTVINMVFWLRCCLALKWNNILDQINTFMRSFTNCKDGDFWIYLNDNCNVHKFGPQACKPLACSLLNH